MSSVNMCLSFIAPELRDGKPVVQLRKEVTEEEFNKWQNALILYVLTEPSITLPTMRTFVEQEWSMVDKPALVLHEEDRFFSAVFNSLDDRNTILCSGPFYLCGEPIIMKPWTPDLNLQKEVFLRFIPLWVKFPNLPLNCWGMDSLSRIASVIGEPLITDECTFTQSRISYARALIDTDVSKLLPDTVTVEDPTTGIIFVQKVEFQLLKEDDDPIIELYNCVNTYREAAMSNDHKFDHICLQDRLKVLNVCAEAEAWLKHKKMQQDALPNYTTPVLTLADVKQKANEVDRLCNTILTKPRSAAVEKIGTQGTRQMRTPINYDNWKEVMLKYQMVIRMAVREEAMLTLLP